MISAAAASAAVFNLLCTGAQGHAPASATSMLSEKLATVAQRYDTVDLTRTKSFSRELRLDLARGRWCYNDDCASTVEFERVSADTIVFSNGCSDLNGLFVCSSFKVDRETGRFRYHYYDAKYGIIDAVGSCLKRRSPGLPHPKF